MFWLFISKNIDSYCYAINIDGNIHQHKDDGVTYDDGSSNHQQMEDYQRPHDYGMPENERYHNHSYNTSGHYSYNKVKGCLFVCFFLYRKISLTSEPIGFSLTG